MALVLFASVDWANGAVERVLHTIGIEHAADLTLDATVDHADHASALVHEDASGLHHSADRPDHIGDDRAAADADHGAPPSNGDSVDHHHHGLSQHVDMALIGSAPIDYAAAQDAQFWRPNLPRARELAYRLRRPPRTDFSILA